MDCATEGRVEDYAEQPPLDFAEGVVVIFCRIDLRNGVSRIDLGKPQANEAPCRRNGDPAFFNGLHVLEPSHAGHSMCFLEGVVPDNQSLPF